MSSFPNPRRPAILEGPPIGPTPEEVFHDYEGRRVSLIRALTTDFQKFSQQCDPKKEELCLYGFPNGEWEVRKPEDELPTHLPEPTLGINFPREDMIQGDWLALVAIHSDSWLMAMAFHSGALLGFTSHHRKRLFDMINELPTIYEVFCGTCNIQPLSTNNSSNRSKSNSKAAGYRSQVSGTEMQVCQPAGISRQMVGYRLQVSGAEMQVRQLARASGQRRAPKAQSKYSKRRVRHEEEEEESEEEDEADVPCRVCGKKDEGNEFWIQCDICDTWFHGSCVKITPAMDLWARQYVCSSCCR